MKVTLSYDEENKRSLLTYNLVITCEWQSIVLTQTPSLTKIQVKHTVLKVHCTKSFILDD